MAAAVAAVRLLGCCFWGLSLLFRAVQVGRCQVQIKRVQKFRV